MSHKLPVCHCGLPMMLTEPEPGYYRFVATCVGYNRGIYCFTIPPMSKEQGAHSPLFNQELLKVFCDTYGFEHDAVADREESPELDMRGNAVKRIGSANPPMPTMDDFTVGGCRFMLEYVDINVIDTICAVCAANLPINDRKPGTGLRCDPKLHEEDDGPISPDKRPAGYVFQPFYLKKRIKPLPVVVIQLAPDVELNEEHLMFVFFMQATYIKRLKAMLIDQGTEDWFDHRSVYFQIFRTTTIWKLDRFTASNVSDYYNDGSRAPNYDKMARVRIRARPFPDLGIVRRGHVGEPLAVSDFMRDFKKMWHRGASECVATHEESGILINEKDPSLATSSDGLINIIGPAHCMPVVDFDAYPPQPSVAPAVRNYLLQHQAEMLSKQRLVPAQAEIVRELYILEVKTKSSMYYSPWVLQPGEKLDCWTSEGNVHRNRFLHVNSSVLPYQANLLATLGIPRLTFDEKSKMRVGANNGLISTEIFAVAKSDYILQMYMNCWNTGAKGTFYERWTPSAYQVSYLPYDEPFFKTVLKQLYAFRAVYFRELCNRVNEMVRRETTTSAKKQRMT